METVSVHIVLLHAQSSRREQITITVCGQLWEILSIMCRATALLGAITVEEEIKSVWRWTFATDVQLHSIVTLEKKD